MWRLALLAAVLASCVQGQSQSGEQLVSNVLSECSDMSCVKHQVLIYLNSYLKSDNGSARNAKNLDAIIFKRAARVVKTHEFRFKLPEEFFDRTEIVYNPRTGLDVATADTEARGLLKKKLLLPLLLLFKLKMKALMPIFVGLIGLKSLKALILSKLAIGIVLGFVIYQLCTKAGMAMPMMSMAPTPAPEPHPIYGAPAGSTPSTNSYEPGWEPNPGGPYSRVWSPSVGDSQSMAYSGYYPGPGSSTTNRP